MESLLRPETLALIVRVVVLIVVGLPAAYFLSRLGGRAASKHLSEQSGMLVRKGVLYTAELILLAVVLNQLGFKLAALLGAAGIVGVAVGFAAQTSVSNIISGLFLISEKPFQVGDVISVGSNTGTVMSVDLLSVKVRTFDNRFIRLPNETIIKTEVTNLTRYPIRRIDLKLGVAYREDVRRVMALLEEIAVQNPLCLDEPRPLVSFQGFGESALELLFGVWCLQADYLELRNSILCEIKERFAAEGIELPFPQRTLYAGGGREPLPVRLITEPGPKPEGEKPQGAA
jgi:small-conductance mechanosensitive channel